MHERQTESWGDRVTRWIYAAGPSGLAPIAPGTFGTFTACILLALPGRVPGIPEWSLPLGLIAFVVVLLVGVWSASKAEVIHGKDPGIVVIDEVAGMIVTVLALPHAGPAISWQALIFGFFIFRAMDILKPWPVRKLESLPRGWGVMMDDVLAGVYANVLLRVALVLWARVT
ncbi:MAG: phosphatidylglycerophosphatase A [Gemmatimonadetes bacterium]|nr:phosphatidylglycerophosphatase A [Gemmatimonadota bacterium]